MVHIGHLFLNLDLSWSLLGVSIFVFLFHIHASNIVIRMRTDTSGLFMTATIILYFIATLPTLYIEIVLLQLIILYLPCT